MSALDETLQMQRQLLTKAAELLSTAMELQVDLERKLAEGKEVDMCRVEEASQPGEKKSEELRDGSEAETGEVPDLGFGTRWSQNK